MCCRGSGITVKKTITKAPAPAPKSLPSIPRANKSVQGATVKGIQSLQKSMDRKTGSSVGRCPACGSQLRKITSRSATGIRDVHQCINPKCSYTKTA
jgi:hypothetical protein